MRYFHMVSAARSRSLKSTLGFSIPSQTLFGDNIYKT